MRILASHTILDQLIQLSTNNHNSYNESNVVHSINKEEDHHLESSIIAQDCICVIGYYSHHQNHRNGHYADKEKHDNRNNESHSLSSSQSSLHDNISLHHESSEFECFLVGVFACNPKHCDSQNDNVLFSENNLNPTTNNNTTGRASVMTEEDQNLELLNQQKKMLSMLLPCGLNIIGDLVFCKQSLEWKLNLSYHQDKINRQYSLFKDVSFEFPWSKCWNRHSLFNFTTQLQLTLSPNDYYDLEQYLIKLKDPFCSTCFLFSESNQFNFRNLQNNNSFERKSTKQEGMDKDHDTTVWIQLNKDDQLNSQLNQSLKSFADKKSHQNHCSSSSIIPSDNQSNECIPHLYPSRSSLTIYASNPEPFPLRTLTKSYFNILEWLKLEIELLCFVPWNMTVKAFSQYLEHQIKTKVNQVACFEFSKSNNLTVDKFHLVDVQFKWKLYPGCDIPILSCSSSSFSSNRHSNISHISLSCFGIPKLFIDNRGILSKDMTIPINHNLLPHSQDVHVKNPHQLLPTLTVNIHSKQQQDFSNTASLSEIVKQLNATLFVLGDYLYFHYNQDNIIDQGWGCAYRSLQTICSWILLNSIRIEPGIPSHKQIQETLIKIGDKPSNFLNSKEWIGCNEVGFVLNERYGIEFQILTHFPNQDLTLFLKSVYDNFRRLRCPVMIGGGVLALTLIGIQKNSENDFQLCILDPHINSSDLILKKVCYWATPSQIFRSDQVYNLLFLRL